MYTWVNGSDEKLILELNAWKKKLRDEATDGGASGDGGRGRSKLLINAEKFKWKTKTVMIKFNRSPLDRDG